MSGTKNMLTEMYLKKQLKIKVSSTAALPKKNTNKRVSTLKEPQSLDKITEENSSQNKSSKNTMNAKSSLYRKEEDQVVYEMEQEQQLD